MIIGENKQLSEGQKLRVLERVRKRGTTCGSCDSGDFVVGEALYLGFLFLNEGHGNYMVALTCEDPDCASPRTGIRLQEFEFLSDE